MFDSLVSQQPALLVPILSVIGAALVFLVWIIAHYWAAIRRVELEAGLKREMLNRGLAAADIERVLMASSAGRDEPTEEKEAIGEYEHDLITKMLDAKYSAEEIERLVRAFKSGEKTDIRLPDRMLR